MQWTSEQRRAIEEKNQNILLSAAAGSGKTTVLVARVLDLIIGGGAKIDRMLIVTFTRAASADMRRKLSAELTKRAAEGDARCRDQLLLLERASITTLHGFCSDFLRTYFESADVDPAFRVLDDAENRRLADEALDEAMEEAYANMDEALVRLNYARGPKNVRGMAESLIRMLEERPEPEKWLEAVCTADDLHTKMWFRELCYAAKADIRRAILYARQAMAHSGCSDTYHRALETDVENLERMCEIERYENLRNAVCAWKQTAARTKRGENPPDEEVTRLRKNAKTAMDKIALREIDPEIALSDVRALMPQLRRLGDIALRAQALLNRRKAENAALSYADLEHKTLAALQNEDTARMLRERFDYVFVDEYQDTSDLQEALVNKITRGNNLFMVGDVKQSIYRFRQAEPSLFLEKYERYGKNEGGLLLPLTMNFRSRPKILNFVNHVFERAMIGGDAEITYDEYARLNHGNKALTGGSVEIHRLKNPDSDADESVLEMKACERQAEFISRRITEMMREDPSLRYRDFAVLTRTKRGVLSKMAAVFTQNGIPAFADGGDDFYESVEILLGVNLLKLTANFRSDVELIGALRSPVVGLCDNDLARIRMFAPECPYVDACRSYAEFESDEIAEKLRRFFALLEKWRMTAGCAELGELARMIFDESGLYDACGALPGGRQRQANLDRLVANASAFDQNSSSSLTRFLAHIEKLRARGDGDDAHLLGENDDVVRLMTVHKSKGLEFPVVFSAMMERKYSARQASEAISVHRTLGVGAKYCDSELQTRRKTLPQQAIIQRVRREDRAEELRILYVLLTRAQDKLILVGSEKDIDRADMRYRALKLMPDSAESYFDVILPALIDEKNDIAEIFVHDCADYADALEPCEGVVSLLDTPPADADDALLRDILWVYPEEKKANQPLKLTVTGLLREIQQPNRIEELIERPAFISEIASRMNASERGTAYHRALQFLDIAPLRGMGERAMNAEIRRQIDQMLADRRITPAQHQAVRVFSLANFFSGAIGERLLASTRVEREWPFNVMMRISETLSAEEAGKYGDEEILVQGVIDCCFEEDGQWVLLDYKTSRETDGEALTERYFSQLRMYALALRRITGMEIREINLCLLLSGEHIRVEIDT